jgi:hypothetical protein
MMDKDGEKEYFFTASAGPQVRNPLTGDVDNRYEMKKGGAAFQGPKFYKFGEKVLSKDPGRETIYPTPERSQ